MNFNNLVAIWLKLLALGRKLSYKFWQYALRVSSLSTSVLSAFECRPCIRWEMLTMLQTVSVCVSFLWSKTPNSTWRVLLERLRSLPAIDPWWCITLWRILIICITLADLLPRWQVQKWILDGWDKRVFRLGCWGCDRETGFQIDMQLIYLFCGGNFYSFILPKFHCHQCVWITYILYKETKHT